jgi:myo-inositol-1(or 4)-monophosphatase
LLRHYNPRPGQANGLAIGRKGVIDLVTEADLQSEQFLLGEIRRRFPGHRVIAEESGGLEGDDDHIWYIDPLDGTVNFAHGLPIFSVSLAYAEQGALKLGVVYDPTRAECFSAERGRAAWLNGEPIRVSDAIDLDHSLLVTGFPYDIRTDPDNNLEHYARFALRSQAVRRLGSAALDLCYVAAGRFDGYWELRLKPWDLAAGGLIAQESGCLITGLDGNPNYFAPPRSVVVANPTLHPKILAVLNRPK